MNCHAGPVGVTLAVETLAKPQYLAKRYVLICSRKRFTKAANAISAPTGERECRIFK